MIILFELELAKIQSVLFLYTHYLLNCCAANQGHRAPTCMSTLNTSELILRHCTSLLYSFSDLMTAIKNDEDFLFIIFLQIISQREAKLKYVFHQLFDLVLGGYLDLFSMSPKIVAATACASRIIHSDNLTTYSTHWHSMTWLHTPEIISKLRQYYNIEIPCDFSS